MGKLEEQLRRAEKKLPGAKVKEVNGGPVRGEPGDRWIAYHATLGLLFVAKMISFAAALFGGIPAALLLERNNQLGWIIVLVTLVAIAIVWTVYLVKRSGAERATRFYLSTLPFTLEGYLETMREPRWWAKSFYEVTYKPTLRITWHTDPGDATIEKLTTLVRARFDNGTFESTFSSERDPWKWTRKVIDEVVLPLREKSEVASAKLRIERGVEMKSGD